MSTDLINAMARGFLAANHTEGSVGLMKVHLLLFVFGYSFCQRKEYVYQLQYSETHDK